MADELQVVVRATVKEDSKISDLFKKINDFKNNPPQISIKVDTTAIDAAQKKIESMLSSINGLKGVKAIEVPVSVDAKAAINNAKLVQDAAAKVAEDMAKTSQKKEEAASRRAYVSQANSLKAYKQKQLDQIKSMREVYASASAGLNRRDRGFLENGWMDSTGKQTKGLKEIEKYINNLGSASEVSKAKVEGMVKAISTKAGLMKKDNAEIGNIEAYQEKQLSRLNKMRETYTSGKKALDQESRKILETGWTDSSGKAVQGFDAIEQRIKNLGEVTATTKAEMDGLFQNAAVKAASLTAGSGGNQATKIQNMMDSAKAQVDYLNKIQSSDAFNQSGSTTLDNLRAKADELKTSYKAIYDELGKGDVSKDRFDELTKKAKELTTEMNSCKKSFDMFDGSVKSDQAFDSIAAGAQRGINQIQKMRQEWTKMAKDPSAMSRLSGIEQMFTSAGISGQQSDLTAARNELSLFRSEMQLTGKAGASFADGLKAKFSKFTQWFGVSRLVMGFVQKGKEVIQATSEIDRAMTDLRKVTDETDQAYANFQKRAQKNAVDLATPVTDTIDATSGWSRLGYNDLSEAEGLARWSVIYANVGDDVTNIDDATSSLISTLKAFGTEGKSSTEAVEDIVDIYNKLGNTTSISSGKLGTSLQLSAAALKEANNDLAQSAALTVGAFDVIQNESSVGNMWKTVAMRIRGAKTELEDAGLETEGMAESTSKLRDEIKQLTGGFDIMGDGGKEFKSTYDIILGIADVYSDMTDVSQASLLELLAGKRNGNALAAAINNADEIRRVYDLANNAEGSALTEYDTYLNSVEAHQNRMQAAFQSFSASILSPEIINFSYDTGTGILGFFQSISDVLGSVPTLATAAGAAFSLMFKDSGLFRSSIDSLGNETGGISPFWSVKRQAREARANQINADVAAMENYERYKNAPYVGSAWDDTMLNGVSASAREAARAGKSVKEYRLEMEALGKTSRKLSGTGSFFKSLGRTLLNAGVWMAVSAGISLAVAGIEDLALAHQRAIEASDELVKKWGEENEALASKQKLAVSVQDEYNRLSQGVNQADGSNINLSTDEFERYHEITNQIAENFPSLVSGWDSEGNAILNVTAQVNGLSAAYENLAQQQRDSILKDLNTNAKGVYTEAYENNAWSFTRDGVNLAAQNQQAQIVAEYVRNNDRAGLAEYMRGIIGRRQDSDPDTFRALDIIKDSITSQEDRDEARDTGDYYTAIADKILANANQVFATERTFGQQFNAALDSLDIAVSTIVADAFGEQNGIESFKNIQNQEARDSVQSALSSLFGGIQGTEYDNLFTQWMAQAGGDSSKLGDAMQNWFNNELVKLSSSESISALTGLNTSFGDFTQRDSIKTAREYQKESQEYIDALARQGLSSEVMAEIMQKYSFEQAFEAMQDHARSLLTDADKSAVEDMTYSQLATAMSVSGFDEGGNAILRSFAELLVEITEEAKHQAASVDSLVEAYSGFTSVREKADAVNEALATGSAVTAEQYDELIAADSRFRDKITANADKGEFGLSADDINDVVKEIEDETKTKAIEARADAMNRYAEAAMALERTNLTDKERISWEAKLNEAAVDGIKAQQTVDDLFRQSKALKDAAESYTQYAEARSKANEIANAVDSQGYMTLDQYNELGQEYREAVKFDNLSNSYRVDYDEVDRISKDVAQQRITKATKESEEAQGVLNDALAEYERLLESGIDANDSLALAQKALMQEQYALIESNNLLMDSYEQSTGAFAMWRSAMERGEIGDEFREAKTALDEINEGLKNGHINTNKFNASAKLLFGEDYKEQFSSPEELAKATKEYSKYFNSDGNVDAAKWYKTMEKAGIVSRQGNAYVADGSLSMDQIADKLADAGINMSEAMFRAGWANINETIYDDENKFRFGGELMEDTALDPVADAKSAVESLTAAIEANTAALQGKEEEQTKEDKEQEEPEAQKPTEEPAEAPVPVIQETSEVPETPEHPKAQGFVAPSEFPELPKISLPQQQDEQTAQVETLERTAREMLAVTEGNIDALKSYSWLLGDNIPGVGSEIEKDRLRLNFEENGATYSGTPVAPDGSILSSGDFYNYRQGLSNFLEYPQQFFENDYNGLFDSLTTRGGLSLTREAYENGEEATAAQAAATGLDAVATAATSAAGALGTLGGENDPSLSSLGANDPYGIDSGLSTTPQEVAAPTSIEPDIEIDEEVQTVEIEVEADTSDFSSEVEEAKGQAAESVEVEVTASGASEVAGELETIQSAESEPITKPIEADTSAAQSQIAQVDAAVQQPATKPVDISNISQALAQASQLHENLSRPAYKTVYVTQSIRTKGGGSPSNASGTDSAEGGTTLVGELEPEIIVRKNEGRWFLATSPQLTNLDRGDIVFNGKDTRKILSGQKAGFGTAMWNGGVVGGESFASGVFSKERFAATVAKVKSGGFTGSGKAPTGSGSSNNKKNNNSGGGDDGGSNDDSASESKAKSRWQNLLDAYGRMYDWIQRALEVAKKATDDMIDEVAKKIGYIAKNKTLDEALALTAAEITQNQAAYDRYMQQAEKARVDFELSDDIVERIKNGTIDISEYAEDEDMTNRIEQYKKYFDLAEDCTEQIKELHEQEHELALQKLINITDYYENKLDRLQAEFDLEDAQRTNKIAAGLEVSAKDYNKSVKALEGQLNDLEAERKAYNAQFQAYITNGILEYDSDEWHEYVAMLEEMDQAIIEANTDLIELIDEMNRIQLNNLGYALERLQAAQEEISGYAEFHVAQGKEYTDSDYQQLIDNGFQQLTNLEAQNEFIKEQQEGLDVLSEKWQEWQELLESNEQEIWDIKNAQEEWNDSIADLKIDALQKEQEALAKENNELQRKLSMQQALKELEDAQNQRTKLMFRNGIGFVYEADQDAIAAAQQRVDELKHQETLAKIDEAIDAIEESKRDDNIYDYTGQDVIKSFDYMQDSAKLYEMVFGSSNLTDTVVSGIMDQFEKSMGNAFDYNTNNKSFTITMGDIKIEGVQDSDSLAKAIIQKFPSGLMQELYKG